MFNSFWTTLAVKYHKRGQELKAQRESAKTANVVMSVAGIQPLLSIPTWDAFASTMISAKVRNATGGRKAVRCPSTGTLVANPSGHDLFCTVACILKIECDHYPQLYNFKDI